MRSRARALRSTDSCRSLFVSEPLEPRQLLSASASVTITTTRAQTIDGFGTSLGDLYSTSLVKSAKFQKMYYQDLGSSIFRVALNPWVLKGNGSMGTAVNLGPTLQQNINKMNFLDSNILRYGIMARASLKYAKNVKIIGSIWSPPYWMKGPEVSSATGKPNGVKPAFNDKSANTSENAELSYRILQPLGIRRIFLVTHASHMGRARRSFEKAGFEVVPAPMGYYSDNTSALSPLSWIPNAAGAEMSYICFHEAIGTLWYALTGG